MAPKITREGANKASNGGEELNSKAETDTEAIAAARADDENVSVDASSDRNAKKRRIPVMEDSSYLIAPSTGAETSAGGEDDTGVPSGIKSTYKSYTEMSGPSEAVIVPIDSTSDGDTGVKMGGGSMHVRSSSGAGRASPVDGSAAHGETSANTLTAAGTTTNNSSDVCDEAVSATAVVTTYKSVISRMARANNSNGITEENYYLLHWLYRIRRVGCANGLRIGFLQPDFLWSIYRPMMRNAKHFRRTDGDIRVAVNLWCFDRAAALKRYGHISEWDVSSVTDMSALFKGRDEFDEFDEFDEEDEDDEEDEEPMEASFRGKCLFNDDISRWDVSSVTNMSGMFCSARSFNQPVGDWDVSNVTNMNFMFDRAHEFNQPVGDWDVSKVTNMWCMFREAKSFNQHIGDWDVSKVTNMRTMFGGAHSFNLDVGDWDVYNVTDMSSMFFDALSFNQPVENWDVSNVTDMRWMFGSAQSFNQPVGDWDVSKVTDMEHMFWNAHSFDQDLTWWDMRSVRGTGFMFVNAYAMQSDNKPARLH